MYKKKKKADLIHTKICNIYHFLVTLYRVYFFCNVYKFFLTVDKSYYRLHASLLIEFF